MRTINEIIASITGTTIYQELVSLMHNVEPDYPELEGKYQAAVTWMKDNCGADTSCHVDEYVQAWQQEIIGNLLYSACSGYRANLENFYAPCSTRFVQMDFTDYIREHLMCSTPAAVEASHRQEYVRKLFSDACQEAVATIDEYFIALDVIGPKVAHYVGYVLSNELLRWMVPGYQPDTCQTIDYQCELQKYLGFIPQ